MRLALAAVFAALTPSVLAQDIAALPGGATSLQEAHGDWTVTCALVDSKKACGLSQAVGNQEGVQLVAVELSSMDGVRAEGMMMTAFGLRLADGVTLGIDGQGLTKALPFFTCLQAGCLVPLTLDEVALSAMRLGKSLEVTAVNSQSGQPVTIPLSLAGFTAAYNRTVELSK